MRLRSVVRWETSFWGLSVAKCLLRSLHPHRLSFLLLISMCIPPVCSAICSWVSCLACFLANVVWSVIRCLGSIGRLFYDLVVCSLCRFGHLRILICFYVFDS